MIVVDSSVWIDYFRRRDTQATAMLRTSRIENDVLVGDAILLEVLRGAESDKQANVLEATLRRFVVESMFSPALAVAAARNYRILRAKGITVRKTMDLVIGTFCIEEGHSLLHQDRDFDPMRDHLGLKVVSAQAAGG